MDYARDRLRVQIAFRCEVTVKTSARQSGLGHDIVDRHGVKTVAVEQSACALKD